MKPVYENVEQRLKIVEGRLKVEGVTDVKFFLNPDAKDLNQVIGDAARLLEAYLNGETVVVYDSRNGLPPNLRI